MGHGRAFHVEHLRLEGGVHPFPDLGVVHEGLARDTPAAHHDLRRVRQAGAFRAAVLERHRGGDLLRDLQPFGIRRKPDHRLDALGPLADDAHRLGVDHAETGDAAGLHPGRQGEAVGRLAREDGFEVLAPLGRDHHVADRQGRVHAARDAREHDALNGKAVERELGVHGGVDHGHAAQEQHDGLAAELARDEAGAVQDVLLRAGHVGEEGGPFGLEGGHHRDARLRVERLGEGRARRQQETGGEKAGGAGRDHRWASVLGAAGASGGGGRRSTGAVRIAACTPGAEPLNGAKLGD
jgi:hypothetical protein